MALKKLSSEEMIQLSTPWVSAGDAANEAIMKVPLLAALLPKVQAAHEALFKMRTHAVDSRTQQLSQEAAALDSKYDDLVRSIHGTFTVLADVFKGNTEILQLWDLLLPEGLQHTKKTYRGKAGHAALVASKLDTDTTVALKALTIRDTNLLELVQTWLDTAKKLGDSEEARARLNSISGPTASEVTVARTRWIRMTNALLANSDLIELDEANQSTLFAALRVAEKTADLRGRGPDALEPTAEPAITPLPSALASQPQPTA